MRRQAQRGFTLTELMIVVAIIGVVSAVLFSVNSRTYGANSNNVADEIAALLTTAHMRSISTRRIHRVIIQPSEIQVWASDTTGIVDDNDISDDLFVSRIAIPNGVKIWEFDTSVIPYTPAENAGLYQTMLFKPQGSSSGGTIYIHDSNGRRFRVLVYTATGSVHTRGTW